MNSCGFRTCWPVFALLIAGALFYAPARAVRADEPVAKEPAAAEPAAKEPAAKDDD